MKKAVLKNFTIFKEKLQTCNFIEKRPQNWCFRLNIAIFLRTPILKNLITAVSDFTKQLHTEHQ